MRRPPLVERAHECAERLGFERSCSDADGALLHVLASRRGLVRAGEIGTAAGVGAAWIASALHPGVPFVTCERDPLLVEEARRLFAADPDVHVLEGDWREVMPAQAPFDLLFVDGGHAKDVIETVLGLVVPGGTIVMDDFFLVPFDEPDPRRNRWLEHPEVVSLQVWTTPERRAVLAVRR